MDILNANPIFPSLPVDLDALLVSERAPLGKTIRLIAVGDIGFSGRIERFAAGTGWEDIFREFFPFFQEGQIVFGNFENSLQGSRTDRSRGFFTPLPESVKALQEAGFNVIHLAHNHILDNDVEGLSATIEAIRLAGMTPLGVGETTDEARSLVKMYIGDLCLGWLACGRTLIKQPTDGPKFWEFDALELLSAIEQARKEVDILIVSVHIGLMFIDYPRPEIKLLAEKAIEAGANIILMHHAHVLQGIQVVAENGIVCYNTGNFLFDWQEGDIQAAVVVNQQNEGGVFVFDIDSKGISRFIVLPTVIDKDCSVHWAIGSRGKKILQRLVRISEEILENYTPAFEHQRAKRNTSHIFQDLFVQIRKRDFRSLFSSVKRIRFEHIKMVFLWLGQKNRS